MRLEKKNIFSLGALQPTLEFKHSDWLFGSDHFQPISHGPGPALTQNHATLLSQGPTMNYLFSPTRIYFQANAIARCTKKFTTNLDQNKETKFPEFLSQNFIFESRKSRQRCQISFSSSAAFPSSASGNPAAGSSPSSPRPSG